jgi:hypothetical protein
MINYIHNSSLVQDLKQDNNNKGHNDDDDDSSSSSSNNTFSKQLYIRQLAQYCYDGMRLCL